MVSNEILSIYTALQSCRGGFQTRNRAAEAKPKPNAAYRAQPDWTALQSRSYATSKGIL